MHRNGSSSGRNGCHGRWDKLLKTYPKGYFLPSYRMVIMGSGNYFLYRSRTPGDFLVCWEKCQQAASSICCGVDIL
jgi:hypothetical protein